MKIDPAWWDLPYGAFGAGVRAYIDPLYHVETDEPHMAQLMHEEIVEHYGLDEEDAPPIELARWRLDGWNDVGDEKCAADAQLIAELKNLAVESLKRFSAETKREIGRLSAEMRP